ncbi:hypothetical protein GOODEAATRI_019371 [Goodea atripinnis]|uniref:Uncharacterized protein n=1 Tax=Goodea atripinnis TaxID=208336 RepID=A0ABV0NBX9_9TELE
MSNWSFQFTADLCLSGCLVLDFLIILTNYLSFEVGSFGQMLETWKILGSPTGLRSQTQIKTGFEIQLLDWPYKKLQLEPNWNLVGNSYKPGLSQETNQFK